MPSTWTRRQGRPLSGRGASRTSQRWARAIPLKATTFHRESDPARALRHQAARQPAFGLGGGPLSRNFGQNAMRRLHKLQSGRSPGENSPIDCCHVFPSRLPSRSAKLLSSSHPPSNSERIGLAPQSGLAEVLRLGPGLVDVCLVPNPRADWSLFCFWAEHPGTVSTLLFTGRVVDAIAKVPCSAARANCPARPALAPPSPRSLTASRVVRPTPSERRRALRPRSPAASPDPSPSPRLVRPAPPPPLVREARPPPGPRLLVPPGRTRSSAGSRENKNNRRRRRGAAERGEPGGPEARRGAG